MGVAHTLSRTFFWSQNILWKEDLLKHDATVFLSGKDSIISAPKVRVYLEDATGGEEDLIDGPDQQNQLATKDLEQSTDSEYRNDCLGVVWCANLDHGGAFDLSRWRGRLKAEVLRKVRCKA